MKNWGIECLRSYGEPAGRRLTWKARVAIWASVAAVAAVLVPSAPLAADTFVESDDFKDNEAIHSVFLQPDDYRIMVESLTRNDTSFDWGWVLTPGFVEVAPPPADTRPKALRWLPRKSAQKLVAEPRELGFDVRSFHKVFIPPVENFAGILKPEVLAEIRDNFIEGTKMFGLEVVPDRAAADLALELATLDQMRETANVPVYNIQVKPFILIELRLTAVASGQKLLLLRNRKHGQTVSDAALNFADDFVKFLR